MAQRGLDQHSQDKELASRLAFDNFISQFLETERSIADNSDMLKTLSHKTLRNKKEQAEIESLTARISDQKSHRAYLEYSVFMDYDLRSHFLAYNGNDPEIIQLIDGIKMRNPFFLKE
ncbi:hypothetical protein WJT86_06040 [Microvirga sp. W0021]|uniref:Uncharacterized protein n=1 Tax=Hohaiivirga grylli TaxID=3133970 RepID=A0ABV0BI38_9HYPH